MRWLAAIVLCFPWTALPCSLTIAAASDLAPLRDRFLQQFQKTNICQIVFTFSSSGQLATQIEQGAPFDLYLSASEDFVRKLATRSLIEPESIVVFARGRLGIWAPGRGSVRLEELTQPNYKKIAIANPAHAPYGMAARQALEAAGLWDRFADKLVLGENVRQALQFAETENVDAVITAWSLLATKPGASLIDAKLHKEIRQTLGIVRSSKNKAAAKEFADWLSNGDGRKLLLTAGFY